MTQTHARITRNGKHFEVMVDLEQALKLRKGESINLSSVVQNSTVFNNIKTGDRASSEELVKTFGTDNSDEICMKIIKNGEIVLPTEFIRTEQQQRYKQVADFIIKNAVDKNSRPFAPIVIMNALKEAKIEVKNKPIDTQIKDIVDQLKRIIPIRLETKKIRVTLPAQFTGKAYGVLTEHMEKENWLANGDLEVILNIPAGLLMDFYDKLNGITHGSALSEELKS